MKILHSADWHLDSPMLGHPPAVRSRLRQRLLEVPGKIAALCQKEACDLVLLAGDLFDGSYTQESVRALHAALEEMKVPVFIAPGNHDFVSPDSPWNREIWPENVHIFMAPRIESVALPGLDCRVYGAGYQEMDCPGVLAGFRAEQAERYALGVFHGDPVQPVSPYNPITRQQVQQSGLDYLALGHIHKADRFQSGRTLCAWPGCPMGTGYDELGIKGVWIAQLDSETTCRFVELNTPRFYDMEVRAGENPAAAVGNVLPGVVGEDFYRITLTGVCEAGSLEALAEQFSGFPNLIIRDQTTRPVDLWSCTGEDSFEGVYFGLLKAAAENGPERETALLAARLSRQILQGQEVELP